jgi:iron complex outermembrane receptor protein
MLVDGRDVTMEVFGHPMWAAEHFSLGEIERIEVVRGPGSALYGANAFQGVIQVFTRPPDQGPRLTMDVIGGEHGLSKIHIRGREHLGPVAVSVSASMEHEDLWTGRDIDGRVGFRGRLSARWEPTSESHLLLDAEIVDGNGLYHAVSDDIMRSGTSSYVLGKYRWDQLQFQASFDRKEFDVDFGLRFYYPDLGLEIAEMPSAVARVDRLAVGGQHTLELPFHNLVTYGIEYIWNHYESGMFLDPEHNEHRLGLYLQDEFDLAELLDSLTGDRPSGLILTTGLRIDYNSMTRGELSPRAALVYAPWQDHSFRLGYAHAFQKPTFWEHSLRLHLDDIANLGIDRLETGNPNLENETIDSLDLGYLGDFLDGRLRLQVDLAVSFFRNTIYFSMDPDKMTYLEVGPLRIPLLTGEGISHENSDVGRTGYNAEVQLHYRPSDYARVFFSTAYRKVYYDTTGKSRRDEPTWRMNAGGDLGRELGPRLSIRAFYTDSRWSSVNDPAGLLAPSLVVEIPAILLLNARFAWTWKKGNLRLSAGAAVFNLLGSRHREFAGLSYPTGKDFGGERLDRQVILFIRGELP